MGTSPLDLGGSVMLFHVILRRLAVCTLIFGVAFVATTRAIAQGPADFIARLDANGNGMLDPNEVEGRMGMFVQRIAAGNPNIDTSRPIPISTLTEAMSQRMGGGGPGGRGGDRGGPGGGPQFGGRGGPSGGGPQFGGRGGGGPQFGGRGGPGGAPQRGGDRGGRGAPQPNPYEYRETELEPLVPGFGEEDVFTPPLVFGAEAELFTIEVTDRDRQEAARAFRSYDRNNDGKITSEEMRRSRYGADLPMYDKNRDGIITMNEMEYRYARRRVENVQETANNQQRRDDRRRNDEEEEQQFGYQWGERRSYRKAPIVERLPEGLPEWFGRDDADQDGQIAMMEFSTDWSDSVMADFNQFDLSRDGLITPRECLKAVENGAVRGAAPSSDSASDDSSSGSSIASRDSSSGSAASSGGSTEEAPSGIDPKYFNFAKGMIAKYDANNDGALTANEWANMSRDPSASDVDGDGRITAEELARGLMKR